MRFSHLSLFALAGLSLSTPVSVSHERRSAAADSPVENLLTQLFASVQIYTGAINATLAPLSPSSPLLEKSAAIPKIGAEISKITSAVLSTADEIRALAPPNATQPTRDDEDETVNKEKAKRYSSDNTAASVAITSPLDMDVAVVAQPKSVKRQAIAIAALLSLIIIEIFATITAAVAIVGIAGLLVFLNPLTGALSALILAVQLVLDVVLVGVIALLNTLLTSLALGLSGL